MTGTVRGRATLAAAAVVALALLAGAVAFSLLLTGAAEETARASAETEAERLAERVATDGPEVVTTLDDTLAQVLRGGTVVATSPEAQGLRLGPDDGRATVDGDPVLIVIEDVDGTDLDVVLAHELDDSLEVVASARWLFLAGIPVLVALVAGLAWWITGRALAPVTRIRAEVDSIEAARLGQRIDVPPTGDEIAQLAVTMNRMLDRLDDAARAQRQFVSDASHELRSPLATIHQHAELATLHPDSIELAELADVVLAEGSRLHALVDALLVLARLDEGGVTAHGPVDLDDVVLTETGLTRGGIAIDTSQVSPVQIDGDERLLRQLVRNLLDNAARHARERIDVTLGDHDGHVILTVDDDGSGVPATERERIFDRFVRLDEARARDDGGSGLGLSIVRAIAAAHDATVHVEDAPTAGARFVVTWPRT